MIDNISIVIPSYNEHPNISEVYNRSLKVIKKLNIKKYELIFIDNGSTDKSLELLKKINSEDKFVKNNIFFKKFWVSICYSGRSKIFRK